MAGGARITTRPTVNTTTLSSDKTSRSTGKSFQEALGRTLASEPKVSFTGLSRVLQTGEVPHSQRVEAFKLIADKIISNPAHPYSGLEAGVRAAMIDSVAEAMASSHYKIPTRIA